MNILCTFSGKIGDILWSLATVKRIAVMSQERVDMGIMPAYESLLPLLNSQCYIHRAFVIPTWECTGSPCGDQPWQAPDIPCAVDDTLVNYDKVFHLTYRHHPPANYPLINFIAGQYNINLGNPIPFIEVDEKMFDHLNILGSTYVALAFNDYYKDRKELFVESMIRKLRLQNDETELKFVMIDKLHWKYAALVAKKAACFIGCRSSNHVLAHGVGQKNIFIYEPHPHRNHCGPFGTTFTNPYTKEIEYHYDCSPEEAAENAAQFILWTGAKVNETSTN